MGDDWLAECARLCVVTVDREGAILDVHGAHASLLGYTRDELVGTSAFQLLSPADRARSFEDLTAPVAVVLVHRSGASIDVDISWRAIGAVWEIAVVDASRRVEAERKLRTFENDLAMVLGVLPEPAVVHFQGTILTANEAFVALLEADHVDQLVGQHSLSHVHPDDREFVTARLSSTLRNRRTPEHRLVSCKGTVIPVEVTGVPFLFGGRVVALATVHDLRARKRHEAELAAADRMATLGRTASAIGHEINNPLTYLQSSLELALRDLPDTDKLAERLRAALHGAERVRDIVRDLKGIASGDDGPIGAVDLRHVLDVAIATTQHEIEHRARLVRPTGELPLVIGAEVRLIQVFVNLLVNAAQALPDGDAASHEIAVATRVDSDHVTVEVLDTGAGFAGIDVARIFEPFYTSKAGTGMGLGLSIAHRLVNACGGTIAAEQRTPRGACFRVTLSRAPATIADGEPAMRDAQPVPARARVLFAEDEEMIRRIAPEILVPHDVVTVESGREAISLLARGEHFDAILCDLQMPNQSGVDVYEWLAAHRPELTSRIVFMTGGVFTDRAESFLRTVGRPHIAKPLDVDHVHRLIAAMIG